MELLRRPVMLRFRVKPAAQDAAHFSMERKK